MTDVFTTPEARDVLIESGETAPTYGLEKFARQLAKNHTAIRHPGIQPALTKELDAYGRLFRDATRYFRGASEQELALSYAAEWMLDNSYIIQQTLRQIGEDLPERFYRQLTKLSDGRFQGLPRVYALAVEIITFEKAHIDLDRVRRFIHAYESVTPLTMGELWALPIMLRLGILQCLALSVARITKIGIEPYGQKLRVIDLTPGLTDDSVVANCFISLRVLAAQDWKDFFESLSLVELILSRDPVGQYVGMDFETRDRYRKVVEEISVAAGKDELEVAREAVRLSQVSLDSISTEKIASQTTRNYRSGVEASSNTGTATSWAGFAVPRTAHVGYYLVDLGRKELERGLDYQPDWSARLSRWVISHPTLVYLSSISLITLVLLILIVSYAIYMGGTTAQWVAAGLLGVLPALNVSVILVNWVITNTVKPRVLPKMDFSGGIPEDCRAMVVVPALFSSFEEIRSLFQQLELHYLRNLDPQLTFALLTDFSDGPEQHMPEDEALIRYAVEEVIALNEKYGQESQGPFYLFHRERRWNPGEERWIGWERKRGKLHELNQLILGQGTTSFTVQIGHLAVLPTIRYVITLDADTILPRESARQLVATLAHPLNRAEFASSEGDQAGEVIAGYTILQPRTEISPTSANRSWFTRIFSGDTGLDLYTLAVSDVYQDFFGEGIYVGKGIYDVAAFERSLAGRIPENALLSHDLFEGIHGRVGLVTDIVLIEDFPPHYLVHVQRYHRWVRGDWQLLPWLLPRVPAAKGKKIPNRLSVIDRWKILDNLRRSLVSPVLLLWFIASWLWFPGSALVWTLAGVSSLAAPLVTEVFSATVQFLQGSASRKTLSPLLNGAARWLLALAFLPYEAQLDLDAIFSTLVRVLITRKGMLRWTTAAQTEQHFGKGINSQVIWRQMITGLLLGVILILLIGLNAPQVLLVAMPLLILWLFSPEIAYWVSLPIRLEITPLDEDQRQQLRKLARRTWLFFEQFVGPEDHWLPPDHYQELPLGIVAHRTSPTNVGLAILSTLAAYDLGYLGGLDLAARLRITFENLDKLERFRGHFLNWYDTRSLDPLPPRYVSTVDSGNLAACLIALGQACLNMVNAPVLRWETWQGLLDTFALLLELLEQLDSTEARIATVELHRYIGDLHQHVLSIKENPDAWVPMLVDFSRESWIELDRRLVDLVESSGNMVGPETLRKMRIYHQRLHLQLENALREIELLLPWLVALSPTPENRLPALFLQTGTDPRLRTAWESLLAVLPTTANLGEIDRLSKAGQVQLAEMRKVLEETGGPADVVQEALAWCSLFAERLDSAGMASKVLLIGYQDLYRQADKYVQEMDFTFLFDPQRQVFHIGYNLELGKPDNNYYDLLASEARIASLVAIAKGDVPQSHWLHIGRPFTQLDSTRVLLSWSATMFEYLMPQLFLRSYEGTLLNQSLYAAVSRQIAYGDEKEVPWGISESGYYRFDANQVYQYRAFGVPGLGYKRGLSEDLVITPYASFLALPLRPQDVMENLANLIRYRMMGTYGLYEAIDFTSSRLTFGNKHQIVQEYMAHHQGMILLSLLNYLKDNLMVQRFHADPRIQAVELLLQEEIPDNPPIEHPHTDDGRVTRPTQAQLGTLPWRVRVQVPQPRVHVLSNGRYSLVISSTGSGFSSWQDIDLTRWRGDTTLNNWGSWIYVQDRDLDSQAEGSLWSAGFQPTGVVPESQDVTFNAHMVEFRRRDRDISLSMEITTPPEDDMEIRLITLTNHSDNRRKLRLTSYGEVILAAQSADQRHPAFNKLFIESEYLPEINSLLYRRRPRSEKEEPVYMIHTLAVEQGKETTGGFEGDRALFLGRGQTVRRPETLIEGRSLSGTVGATLDPIFSLAQDVDLEPHAAVQVAFMTIAANSRQQVTALAGRYHSWHLIERAFEQARSQAELELRQLGLSTPEMERIERLLSGLLYPASSLRAPAEVLAANRNGQPGLWPFSISGDYPILLLIVRSQDDLPLVQELLQAHAFWRNRQIKVDLVIFNEKGTNYGQELNSQVHRLLRRMNSEAWLNRRGGIFLLLADQMNDMDRVLLETAARVILRGENGLLADQLRGLDRLPPRLPSFVPTLPDGDMDQAMPALPRPENLLFDNGLGGFSPDGREYLIYLEPGQWTPAPWVNVIANPEFGFLVSEAGSSFTWAVNSGENRLTPWSNDPVSDPPSEALYLRDEETAEVWSPTPLPARAAEPYLIRHGAGYSEFEHHSHGLKQRVRMFAVQDAPLKVVQLRLENAWKRVRRITATFYAEWVLGVNREATQQFVVPEYDGETQALLARNAYHVEFGDRVAFAAANKPLHGLTADRTEFLGRMGSYARPAALGRIGLASAVEAGIDPCAALQVHIDLQPGDVEEVFFLLGEGSDREDALALVGRFKAAEEVSAAWEAVGDFWESLLGTISVQTPEPAMNLLLNRWLLYQTLSCRIWGRSAFYQSSGAYGFRDQLQDVMAIIYSAPQIAREHLLRSAAHQFEAGDVLHWWHPPSGRGVRTRFSDDLLWLPFVTAQYVAVTGDDSILSEKIPFKKGPALEPGEEERYGLYQTSAEEAKLDEHCRRALEKGSTSGPHNLPLMGTGDWNDGMNRVGADGRGESVWLGWFLNTILVRFAELCERQGDTALANVYRERAGKLSQALEAYGWDGRWYLRAFYDDGTPLGSAQNKECQIDSIAQSWAVLSGAGDPKRSEQAMQSVLERLVRLDDQLILLFTPPFDKTPKDPGYIKGYLPGIRENGGQYTHAALWTVWAFASLGQGDLAEDLFRMINPIYHSDRPDKVGVYRVEPYVIAADVYGVPPHTGRGGWTWYTGSSGWMYRLGVEAILGLQQEGDTIRIDPCIPKNWPGYEMIYRRGETCYQIKVDNTAGVNRGVQEVCLDGAALLDGKIPILADGRPHQVLIRLG